MQAGSAPDAGEMQADHGIAIGQQAPFAQPAATLRGMAAPRSRPLSVRVSERAHGNCSEAYLWLRVRYRRLLARMNGRYPPYREVAAEMAEEGVCGGLGRVVTEKAVRRMWARVCRDIKHDAKTRLPLQPATPAHWRPASAALTAPNVLRQSTRVGPSPENSEFRGTAEVAEARIQAVLAEAARRSGR